jgi:hypothetical protein
VVVRVDEDVAGLDVTMHDPAHVGGLERLGDLDADPSGTLGCEGSLACDERAQIRAST